MVETTQEDLHEMVVDSPMEKAWAKHPHSGRPELLLTFVSHSSVILLFAGGADPRVNVATTSAM